VSNNVEYLPIWKNNATAAERFDELAMIARKHPERFAKMVVVYIEVKEESTCTRQISAGCTTHEQIGVLAAAQFDLISDSNK
jgi:hypothetical protein